MSLKEGIQKAKQIINNIDPCGIEKRPFSNYYHDNIRMQCFMDSFLNYSKFSVGGKQSEWIEDIYDKDKKACSKFMNHIKTEFILQIRQNNESILNGLEDVNFRNNILKSKEFHDMIESIYWWNCEIEQVQN